MAKRKVLTIQVELDGDDISHLASSYFDEEPNSDSLQALLEGLQGKTIAFTDLINTIEDAIVNEDND